MCENVGAGSVWNVNSWHWENKNYTPIATELIKNKILDIVLQENEIIVSMIKIKNIKGEAHINIRKGKQILCYEFDLEVEWRAEDKNEEVEGSFKISDINETDLDFQIYEIRRNEVNDLGAEAIKILKNNLKNRIEDILKNFNRELAEIESDPKKLEEDKIKREKALQETIKAKIEKGAEKERLLEEQKLKEKQMKQEFSQWKEKN